MRANLSMCSIQSVLCHNFALKEGRGPTNEEREKMSFYVCLPEYVPAFIQPLRRMRQKVNLLAEFYRFEFRDFSAARQVLPNRLRLQNTPTTSLLRGETPLTSIPVTTRNNLILWLQKKQGPWGMRSTLLLLSMPGPLWPSVVALYRVLSMGWI